MSQRVFIMKKSTLAIWSSVMPESGVWRKESLGLKWDNTCRVGSVTQNFFPFGKRHKGKFELYTGPHTPM